MIRFLKKLFRIQEWEILETKYVNYREGDRMIRETADKPDGQKWVLAPEEDRNRNIEMVFLCRKIRK